MDQNILKVFKLEKYKDPKHVWDEIDQNTKTLIIENTDRDYRPDIFETRRIYKESIYKHFPKAIFINLYEFPPSSIISLNNFPKDLPYLERFWIHNLNFNSIQGIPENLPKLTSFSINETTIPSLKGFPQDLPCLKELAIRNVPIQSLNYLPESLPSVEKFTIFRTNITNLLHLPANMPELKELVLTHNDLITLKGIPNNLPNLVKLNIKHNHISHLKHLPNFGIKKYATLFIGNPIRSLHGIDEQFLKRMLNRIHFQFKLLCPRGIKIFKDLHPSNVSSKIINEAINFYKKSSHELAQQYVTDSKSLNEGEIERLIWEADLDDRKLLENNISPNDSVLTEISQRLKILLNSDYSLLK